MRTLCGHQDAVTCLQFDAMRIISGSLDCNLKFWDIHTGDCVNTIDWKAAEGHTGVVRCLQADNWRLVSAADDKTIKVNFLYFSARWLHHLTGNQEVAGLILGSGHISFVEIWS